ncbi:unnamed protein product [Oppiella nova]|uniref:Protein kinase domain-containing protein n=1 Tax=Oppiella nova TaxID=334625 RepID=A0A7R9LH51_9ACAR|nr:unnamed protein product [Oppiella nova]CAG2163530.1 unnamed protein product [Oppiella nova]
MATTQQKKILASKGYALKPEIRVGDWSPQSLACGQAAGIEGHFVVVNQATTNDINQEYHGKGSLSDEPILLNLNGTFTSETLKAKIYALLKQDQVKISKENILLKQKGSSSIKVIDFGSSCFAHQRVYTYIQSRFYRSPEVILGLPYGTSIDVWSLGCILAELYTGYPIFPGENEGDQLLCIMEIIGTPPLSVLEASTRRRLFFGTPPLSVLEASTRRRLFFDSKGNPRNTTNSKGKKRKPGSKPLGQALNCNDNDFVDFLSRCLEWNPMHRMTPDEACKHVWLAGHYNHITAINNNHNNIMNNKLESNNRRTSSTAKSIQSLTVREIETVYYAVDNKKKLVQSAMGVSPTRIIRASSDDSLNLKLTNGKYSQNGSTQHNHSIDDPLMDPNSAFLPPIL